MGHGCGSFGVRLLSQEGFRVRAGGFSHLGELTGLYDDNPPSCDNAPSGTRKPSTVRTRTLPETATLLRSRTTLPGTAPPSWLTPKELHPWDITGACPWRARTLANTSGAAPWGAMRAVAERLDPGPAAAAERDDRALRVDALAVRDISQLEVAADQERPVLADRDGHRRLLVSPGHERLLRLAGGQPPDAASCGPAPSCAPLRH